MRSLQQNGRLKEGKVFVKYEMACVIPKNITKKEVTCKEKEPPDLVDSAPKVAFNTLQLIHY